MGRDILRYIKLLRAPSNLTLNTSNDGASTTSLGNLFQCPTTFIITNFFLMSHLNLLSFSLKPLRFSLSLHALVKSLSVFHISPLSILKGHNEVSLQPSLLQAEQLHLSQQSHLALCCSIPTLPATVYIVVAVAKHMRDEEMLKIAILFQQ